MMVTNLGSFPEFPGPRRRFGSPRTAWRTDATIYSWKVRNSSGDQVADIGRTLDARSPPKVLNKINHSSEPKNGSENYKSLLEYSLCNQVPFFGTTRRVNGRSILKHWFLIQVDIKFNHITRVNRERKKSPTCKLAPAVSKKTRSPFLIDREATVTSFWATRKTPLKGGSRPVIRHQQRGNEVKIQRRHTERLINVTLQLSGTLCITKQGSDVGILVGAQQQVNSVGQH